MRPYNKIYTPWNWRGWWDFGTGALGDMACHILHPVFKGLQLGYPDRVQGQFDGPADRLRPERPDGEIRFPARAKKEKSQHARSGSNLVRRRSGPRRVRQAYRQANR